MKTITLTQPFASLVALGVKPIETRSWRTTYRGEIAIHAAKGFPAYEKEMCRQEPFVLPLARHLGVSGLSIYEADIAKRLPVSAVVAIARIVDCVPTSQVSIDDGYDGTSYLRYTPFHSVAPIQVKVSADTYAFGDFSPGRWAWLLDDIRPLPEPVPAKGALSLWEWDVPPETQEWMDKGAGR